MPRRRRKEKQKDERIHSFCVFTTPPLPPPNRLWGRSEIAKKKQEGDFFVSTLCYCYCKRKKKNNKLRRERDSDDANTSTWPAPPHPPYTRLDPRFSVTFFRLARVNPPLPPLHHFIPCQHVASERQREIAWRETQGSWKKLSPPPLFFKRAPWTQHFWNLIKIFLEKKEDCT